MDEAPTTVTIQRYLGALPGDILAGDNAVKTDMGGAYADREISQGAAGVVFLALDAPQDVTGQFLRDGNVLPW